MLTFCEYCNKFVNTHIQEYSDTIEVKGVPISITAEGAFCDECNERLFDRELDNNALLTAYRLYREQKGLLQPEEIKAIREKYNLSQIAFSRLLGFGDKTITRYERGSLQDESPDTLIASVNNPKTMMEILSKRKTRISKSEYEKAISLAESQLMDERFSFGATCYRAGFSTGFSNGVKQGIEYIQAGYARQDEWRETKYAR